MTDDHQCEAIVNYGHQRILSVVAIYVHQISNLGRQLDCNHQQLISHNMVFNKRCSKVEQKV